jgi:hypothetical protein
MVFGNRVLGGIFGVKRDGVTGEWRKLHNEVWLQLGIYCRSVTVREGRGVMVFGNRVLGGIFGARSDGVTGEWRKLHNGVFEESELRMLNVSTTELRRIL